ncbi:MAG: repressor LexA [Bacteroidetes bacterium QS_8_68_15]|nr:MAG: repressor LexA [Bacteroidetes bacterium QS_8_68_15]
MSRKKLTAKQHAFLQYLIRYVREEDVWPTYREITDHFGYRSPNSVTQNLKALRKKGFLTRDEQGYHLADKKSVRSVGGIPVKGLISAGSLQEAVEADLGTITLDTLFPNLDELFAIRVAGQSMNGADIHDGDYVLLIDEDIPEGGIGAVLYDGETSLKRVYHGDRGLRLEPANEEYDDIHITPDVFEEVTVLGRYVGHVNDEGIFKRSATA